MTNDPTNDCAVVFVCDQSHVRFTLFMIWQICHHNPARKFDFVIYSPDEIVLPDWAAPWGVQTYRAKPLVDVPKRALFNGMEIPLYRFGVARDLGARYRRILYMDTDMMVEGGDFNRLFEMDLQGLPIAGALDVLFIRNARFWADEYKRVGLSARPFMNAGLQLIDVQAYLDQEVERLAWTAIRETPHAIVNSDQSALNLALKGRFAELSPKWNWQENGRLPLVTLRYPVFVRHFIARQKLNRDSSGRTDARFNLAYREFFARHDPDFLAQIAHPCDPSPMSFRDAAGLVWRHLRHAEMCRTILGRHPDPYKPRIPEMRR